MEGKREEQNIKSKNAKTFDKEYNIGIMQMKMIRSKESKKRKTKDENKSRNEKKSTEKT